MRPTKTPQKKKAEAYSKQRRYQAWSNDKADRKNRPKAKALDHRIQRRREQEALAVAVAGGEVGLAEGPAPVRRPELQYCSTARPLGESLKARRSRSADAVAYNYFKVSYRGEDHREPFSRFLAGVVVGGTGDSRELALLFREILELPESINSAAGRRYGWWPQRGVWLRRFFADEPEWERRLRQWIDQVLET